MGKKKKKKANKSLPKRICEQNHKKEVNSEQKVKSETSKIDKLNKASNWLQIIASIFAIVGISVLSIFGPVFSCLPSARLRESEASIAQVHITNDKRYIESCIDIPQQTRIFEYHDNEGNLIIGSRSLFISEFYYLITYYNSEDICIGYILISRDPNFSPELFKSERFFEKEIDYSLIEEYGRLHSVGISYGARRDHSSFYVRFYTHHLATNSCYIGLGFSDLGYVDDYSPFTELTENNLIDWSRSYFVIDDYDEETREQLIESASVFSKSKPNVYMEFLCDDSYDLDDLLNQELYICLAVNHIDVSLLTE